MAEHICPWWMGYLLASPIRRLLEKPENLVGPFVGEGMTVVDYGCGMGFFTIPLARMVGPRGKIIAVDVQEKMLTGLRRRAERAGVSDRIETILADVTRAITDGLVDFVAVLHVVHELPDPKTFFLDMRRIMKPGARLLIVEPGFHVTEGEFQESVNAAQSIGLHVAEDVVPSRNRNTVLFKPYA